MDTTNNNKPYNVDDYKNTNKNADQNQEKREGQQKKDEQE